MVFAPTELRSEPFDGRLTVRTFLRSLAGTAQQMNPRWTAACKSVSTAVVFYRALLALLARTELQSEPPDDILTVRTFLRFLTGTAQKVNPRWTAA